MKRILTVIALGTAILGFASLPARADLKLCNNSKSVAQIAIGYKDKEGWASEGWWTIKPNSCAGLLKGPLIARYYYLFGLDDKNLPAWPGKALMCIKDKIFTIRGIDKCQERGYLQKGFFEVDTGDHADYTISLSDTGAGDAATPTSTTVTPTDATKPQQ